GGVYGDQRAPGAVHQAGDHPRIIAVGGGRRAQPARSDGVAADLVTGTGTFLPGGWPDRFHLLPAALEGVLAGIGRTGTFLRDANLRAALLAAICLADLHAHRTPP